MVYPGSWNWELIKTSADHVDISKYAELQKLFNQKPLGSELNQMSSAVLMEMSTSVKRGVGTRIFELTP
jgi:hypothetical protein